MDEAIPEPSSPRDLAHRSAVHLGVVSDTHGHVEYARRAVRMLESLEVDVVIHCGDVGGGGVVDLFAAWPTHFVVGNTDDPRSLRTAIARAGQSFHERFGSLELAGRRIAFTHGDDSAALRTAIDGGQFDLVCHGHTHVPRNERQGKVLLLNPGALYRANPHSLAVVDLPTVEATIITL